MKLTCNDYARGSASGTFGMDSMTYVKVELWFDGLGRGHHRMGNDEAAENTYG